MFDFSTYFVLTSYGEAWDAALIQKTWNEEKPRLEKEWETHMRVTTVQVPQFVVEGTVSEFLTKFGELSKEQSTAVWTAIQNKKYDDFVKVPMQSEAAAYTFFNLYAPFKIVKVRSHSDYGIYYDVTVRHNRPESCSCPDYVNRVKINIAHVCKHMQDVALHPRVYGL